MTACPVCGADDCQDQWLDSHVTTVIDLPRRGRKEDTVVEHLSKQRVYGTDAQGRRVLRYAVGDPIPFPEAVRQGQVEAPPAEAPAKPAPARKAPARKAPAKRAPAKRRTSSARTRSSKK